MKKKKVEMFERIMDEIFKPYDIKTGVGLSITESIPVKINVSVMRESDKVSDLLNGDVAKVYKAIALVRNGLLDKKSISDVALSKISGIDANYVQEIIEYTIFRFDLEMSGIINNMKVKTNTRVITSIEPLSTENCRIVFYSLGECPETKEDVMEALENSASIFDAFGGKV